MSNHFHIVPYDDPNEVGNWSDEEVGCRWLAAFSGRLKRDQSEEWAHRLMSAICSDPERVLELRKRLSSLSWSMKALNEPIARKANQEDHCKGKFWEGRFKCQAMLESHAVLSCKA